MKSALLKATALSAGVFATLSVVDFQPASAAGFSGAYAPAFWDVKNQDIANFTPPVVTDPAAYTDGFVDETSVPSSVTIFGGNFFGVSPVDANGDGVLGVTGATYYLTTLAGSVASYVSFNWDYGTFDDPTGGYDPFGFVVNNVFTLLADIDGTAGNYTFLVNPGDEFGFGVLTVDNAFGAGYATISNFNVTPVPTPALLPGLIGMGVAALRKKQSEAEESEA